MTKPSQTADRRAHHRDRVAAKKMRNARLYRENNERMAKMRNLGRYLNRYAPGSLADRPHEHRREIARRLRQQQRSAQ